MPTASRGEPTRPSRPGLLTLLGTSDLHGRALGFDYYRDVESIPPGGLGRVTTVIEQVRAAAGSSPVLVLDVGDTIQGTPLARPVPIGAADPGRGRRPEQELHPMAAALNRLGVVAAAVGNHDLDFGTDALARYAADCAFPLLAANLRRDGRPAYGEWVLHPVRVEGVGTVRVGLLGLSTPGTAVWNRRLVSELVFEDIVTTAQRCVPELRRAGADVVVVLSHAGLGPHSSYREELAPPENATAALIEQVPGIDAVLLGHAHTTVAERLPCAATGRLVPAAEPGAYGSHVARIELTLARVAGAVEVTGSRVELLPTAAAAEHPAVVKLVGSAHERARAAMAEPVGAIRDAVSLATATVENNPIIRLINRIQAGTLETLLRDTPYGDLPVLSVTAPLSRSPRLPAGGLLLRHLAACYPFDNTLVGMAVTAAELAAYLELSASYYRGVSTPGPHPVDVLTNAPRPDAPNGVPDYGYDIAGDARDALSYDLDLSAPPGHRLRNLRLDGRDLAPTDRFVLAMSSYRAGGGGAFPAPAGRAPLVDTGLDIRGLLVSWIRDRSPVDLAPLGPGGFRLLAGTVPITIDRPPDG